MISVAIIGAGRIGQIRASVINRSSRTSLAAIVDTDARRAQQLAAASVEVSPDWESVMRRNDIDAVVVCTPTKFHADITIAALESGKHVLCEKPLGRNVAEAQRMVDAARAARRVLKTGFNYRHMSHVRKAKELLAAGAIGPLYFLRCRYGHGGRPGYENEWCTNAEVSGGGVLLEQGIHIFDLARYFLEEPSCVTACTSRFYWNFAAAEDNGFCLLRTEAGQIAQIHISWTQWLNIFELELFGRDGFLTLLGRDGHYGPQKLIWAKRNPDHTRPEQQMFEFAPDNSWDCEWREFQAAIAGSTEPWRSAVDGLRAQQMIAAAYSSVSQQSWVQIAALGLQTQGAAG